MNQIETVIPNVLMKSWRPGRYPDNRVDVDVETVDAWIRVAKEEGVRTILCLLDEKQLGYYRQLGEGGLLGRYRAAGFAVIHRPSEDYEPVSVDLLERIASDFLSATLPTLVHCSAGVGRTGEVIRYLVDVSQVTEFREAVLSVMKTHSEKRGQEHFYHVTSLAIRLYDELEPIHQLAPRYKVVLWAAGMLHDIGTDKKGPLRHNWRSGMMIQAQGKILKCGGGLASFEEISKVAALHGIDGVTAENPLGPIPEEMLGLWEDRSVSHELQILAGILRVADGLDRDLDQSVETLSVHGDAIRVVVKQGRNASNNIHRAQEKSGLLSAMLNGKWRILNG